MKFSGTLYELINFIYKHDGMNAHAVDAISALDALDAINMDIEEKYFKLYMKFESDGFLEWTIKKVHFQKKGKRYDGAEICDFVIE